MQDTPLPKTAAEALDARFTPLQQLLRIMARLRAPDGCPWDQEQNHATLRRNVIEEAYEVVAAIDAGDHENLCEELGDLLLQVVFHAQMASEDGRFDFDAISRSIVEKLVRRHPHVFGSESASDSAAVLTRWEEIKRAEKGEAAVTASALDGVTPGLPALMYAEKIQKKAAKVGFDWSELPPVVSKVREELLEVEAAVASGQAEEIEEEIGDLLFAAVNLARKAKVDGEVALQRATTKFSDRFRAVEALARTRGLDLEKMALPEMDALWDEIKAAAKGR